MVPDQAYTLEELLCDESFLRFYFQQSESDELDWDDWAGDDLQRRALIAQAFQLLNALSLQYPEQYVSEQVQNLEHRIKAHPTPTDAPRWRTFTATKWWWAAAALLLLLMAGWWWWQPAAGGPAAPQTIVHATPAAISVCRLPDGSIVRLKTGSSIRLADDFGQQERRVVLVGEAYFEVAKDAQRPFRVQAGQTTTTALGTAFNVRAFPDEAEVKVILVEGKVKVEQLASTGSAPPLKTAELNPGQQVRISTTAFSKVETADTSPIERWKAGYVMTFRATPFAEVAQVLNTHYQTYITGYENTRLAAIKITGEYDRSMPLSEIMESLAFINSFHYEINGDTTAIKIK
jgi:transmembrane sensor